MEGQESFGIAEWKTNDYTRADKTARDTSLFGPVRGKFSQATAKSRFPRVGPAPQNPDGEVIPEEEALPAGPAERPLEESP